MIAFTLGAGLLVLYPPLGAAVITVATLLVGRARLERDWVLIWAGFIAPSAALLLFLGETGTLLQVVAQSALGLAAAALLRPPPQPTRKGLSFGMLLLLALMLVSQASTPLLWNTRATDNIARHLLSRLITGEEEVQGSRLRTWFVPPEADVITFRFRARRTAGLPGWDWLVSEGVSVEAVEEAGNIHSRLHFGTSGDPYAQRIVGTGAPVGGRSFRASLQIRATQPPPPRPLGCRGVWLQVWGQGGGSSCEGVDPTQEWVRVEHEWTAPVSASSSILRLVLNDFDGSTIEVREVRLWERTDTGEIPLSPLVPEGGSLHVNWSTPAGNVERLFTFVPEETPSNYAFQFPLGSEHGGARVTARLQTAGDLRIALSNFTIASDAGKPRATTEAIRQALWFDHPNLLAHSIATLGLLALLLCRTPLQGLLIVLLATAALVPAGSRTALAIFLPAAMALQLFLFKRHRRLIFILLVPFLLATTAIVGASLAGISVTPSILPLNTGQTTSRILIWQFALATFAEHPIIGLAGTGETFASYWLEQGPTREKVMHAHNLFLEFASTYGLLGFLSAVWLAAGLLIMSWRGARWIGCTFAAAVLLLNQFDTTLFFGGVLFPLVLGVNVVRGFHRKDADSPTGPLEPDLPPPP